LVLQNGARLEGAAHGLGEDTLQEHFGQTVVATGGAFTR
jgi:hypothetical protein